MNRSEPAADEPRALDARLQALVDAVVAYAQRDFTATAPTSGEGDKVDVLAAGINMLGEELRELQDEFESKVTERTEDLIAATHRLEIEARERQQTEARLRDLNVQQERAIAQLELLNDEIVALTEMTNLFQVCADRDEAFQVLAHVAQGLFPSTIGALHVYAPSRDALELVAAWGERDTMARHVDPDECWATRRGRRHRSQPRGLRCAHVRGQSPDVLCVPLIAQGETLGLLTIREEEEIDDARMEHREQLATAAAEQIALALANLELRAALQAQSIRDPLTGLYNRRYLEESLLRELRRAERHDTSVVVMMADIDRFKALNDTFGHAAGDVVLREIAGRLRDGSRDEDVACRYGGEEFAVVMADIDLGVACERAEEIRRSVRAFSLEWQGQILHDVTISIGLAVYPTHAERAEALIQIADQALYAAKDAGRDRVAVAGTPGADDG